MYKSYSISGTDLNDKNNNNNNEKIVVVSLKFNHPAESFETACS